MKLSKRLQAIANFIPSNSIVADIGTDHGYIPLYLIENQISKLVIASDVSQGSLNKTINYIHELRLQDKIIPRLGDGIQVIKPFEVDTVVMAGMGGLLIRDIMENDKSLTNSINCFVLQPMIASKELREYLINNNFKIMDEDLVKEENKYYEILFVKKGKECIDKEIYYEIGKNIVYNKHPLVREYIEYKIDYATKIMINLENETSEKSQARYEELSKLISQYKEVLEDIESQRDNKNSRRFC